MKLFNSARFSLARRRRGLRKGELAQMVQVSERSITSYEKGEQKPEKSTLLRIADALDFPVDFFFADDPEVLTPNIASFRSMSKMTAKQRDVALGAGSIALLLNEWIEAKFNLPVQDIPDFGKEYTTFSAPWMSSTEAHQEAEFPARSVDEHAELAAESLRSSWGLGELPVKSMIGLLEAKGVRVYSLAIDAKEVDAFSMWYDNKPFVFLNTFKSAEHCRFDAAHELGHLVLHRHGMVHGPELEREANAFASAFLMPRKSVLANGPRTVTLPAIIQHKKFWTVSVAALNYRLHSIGKTSDWTYRTLCIQLAEQGYRRSEPNPAPHEKSMLLEKVFLALKDEGIDKFQIAKALSIPLSEVNAATFEIMLNVIDEDKKDSDLLDSRKARHLKSVK